MSRLSLAYFACALVLTPTAALAQSTGNIFMELRIGDEDGEFIFANPMEQAEYFNRARCECQSPFQIRYRLAEGVQASEFSGQQVDIWFGSQCTDPDFQVNCLRTPDGIDNYANLQSFVNREYTVNQIIALGEEECPSVQGANSVFALVDVGQDGTFESTSTFEINYDTRAPGVPDNVELSGGEEAVIVSIDLDEIGDGDIQNYEVLCAAVDAPNEPVKDGPSQAPYDRAQDIEGCAGAFDIDVANGGPEVPVGLSTLDPSFICAEGSPSATNIRVDGLENGSQYHVVLVTVDQQRNASATYLGVAEPRPATDFWELYEEEGGSAEGGCNSGGSAGWLLALAVGGLLVRLRRRGATLLAVLAVLAVPALASAQPYWDELDEEITEQGPSRPMWNVGIKLGPYTPSIDDEFSGEGPFERTFGSKDGLMTQVDVEWFFAYPAGQLGLALSLGFHSKSGGAFTRDEDGELQRIEDGENTSFRLYPTTLSAVYRLTLLDDQLGIPVVPYGRLGLAYYYWQITRPGGDLAETDSGGKGRGGSLGWQGSIGVAVRAERIDEAAAASLRNEFGVDHAGFYAELNLAEVDGFGSGSKLSVGDFTWFAGVNFEF
ncbi:MAG: hypothetical protein KJO07_22950 [Deltaproteobacteria bacterium]|nr:hypothetical protein [Deltaproteobacteria bacterium]